MGKKGKKDGDDFGDAVRVAKKQQRMNDEEEAREAISKEIDRVEAETKIAIGEMDKDTKRMLENTITTMRRVMMGENLYTKEMTYQVRSAAQTMLLKNRIFAEAIKQPPLIVEQSRESDSRVKVAPIFQLYIQYDNLLRADLRSLRLNAEAKGQKETNDEGDDALMQIIKKQREEENEE